MPESDFPSSHDSAGTNTVPTTGKVSGKPWKASKGAMRRSHLPDGVKSRSWDERMAKTQRQNAVKALEQELREEKEAQRRQQREVTQERKRIAEEKRRLEEAKAKMGARKAARLRRKAGRSKLING